MSHALLLRLFLSPSFFSVHVALRYLCHYSDNIGITYYLTRRLREYDTNELREVWGLICHLLVTRPSKSRALECFVNEICERSTHISMLTLWFMQATLNDLALSRTDTPAFIICQRTLHHCHELIFGDLPLPLSSRARYARKKVKAQVEPALVGLGMILAGAPGMPPLTAVMGEVALEQGRVNEDGCVRVLGREEDDNASGTGSSSVRDDETDAEGDEGSDIDSARASTPIIAPQAMHARSFVVDRQFNRAPFGAAQTSPALPLHVINIRRSRLSEDPLGQQDSGHSTHTPSLSSPSISTFGSPQRNPAESLLQRYDTSSQIQLLRSHYCHSEVQFLLTLESISNRLLVIPRPARVSALRAELTALNHKLPAEVCMPMWCVSSDAIGPAPSRVPQAHHRVVRIPPGESVVLNSAERAPYVLILEILNEDLDFDPSKRSNKDVLRKIVEKENERKGASHDLVAFSPRNATKDIPAVPNAVEASADDPELEYGEAETGKDTAGPPSIGMIPPTPSTASTPQLPEEEEEIDLVEQLYGPNQSLRSRTVDLSDSVVLPAAPKNKDLDRVAWARTSLSNPATPSTGHTPSFSRTQSMADDAQLSLDEYSERMRMAAVMLAQLNASVVRETVSSMPSAPTLSANSQPAPHVERAGWQSWLPLASASSLGSGTAEPPTAGPLHPTLAGTSAAASASAPTRMKLQPAEATAIRERIMKEMLALEDERMARMRERPSESVRIGGGGGAGGSMRSAEDEGIIRAELNKADPSAVVFSESWAAKKSRIRQASPYGHLASWDCVSVIVKTGGDLRQEQFAVQLIQEFGKIWRDESCPCWVRYFQILITGGTSAVVETITDAVSIHSIRKAEYARRLAEGGLGGYVTLLDHFKSTYGDPSSAKFARAQRNFAKSLAGYSIVTYLLQIKDRHNGNILLDREGHLIHIDFGFMLSNSPGNIGFEAAPFKLPLEYVDVLGGVDGDHFREFRRLFREGFEAARKHCDRIITMVDLMQKDSNFPCFAALGEQTTAQLRERFQPTLTHNLVGEYVDRLIDTSLGSHWTRLYDSFQYYSQSVL